MVMIYQLLVYIKSIASSELSPSSKAYLVEGGYLKFGGLGIKYSLDSLGSREQQICGLYLTLPYPEAQSGASLIHPSSWWHTVPKISCRSVNYYLLWYVCIHRLHTEVQVSTWFTPPKGCSVRSVETELRCVTMAYDVIAMTWQHCLRDDLAPYTSTPQSHPSGQLTRRPMLNIKLGL